MPNLRIDRDRRVADVETAYDPERGIFNHLFATATRCSNPSIDGQAFRRSKSPRHRSRSSCENIFTDFKRHDLGPNFHERNYDGTMRTRVHDDAAVGRRHARRRTDTTGAAST